MLKLTWPSLGIGRSFQKAFDMNDQSTHQSTIHVVDAICHSAQLIASSTGKLPFLAPLVPTLAHSIFLSAKILIFLGETLYQDSEYSGKVRLLRSCIEVFAKRWKIAGEWPLRSSHADHG